MNIQTLIRQIWDKFTALFEGEKKEELKDLSFKRIAEAGNWRTGTGLWSGLIKPFSSRVYYLEIVRTSIADKRELKIKPPPTHTFKLFYFSKVDKNRERITSFLVYRNCYLFGSSDDFIAVELIGKSIFNHLQTLCELSFVGGDDLTNVETIKITGEPPRLKITLSNPGIPATNLLNRSTPQTLSYWQAFIDREFDEIVRGQADKSHKKGFRI